MDLLQARAKTDKLSPALSHIDQLLAEANREKARIDTPANLDPLVPLVYLIRSHFSLEEIDELAFDSGFNPEEIRGETIGERARALVIYASNHGQLPVLLGTCEIKRPFLEWPK